MASPSVLLTGASGYVGGTILTKLVAEDNAWAKELDITTLVRNEAQAQDARQKGVKPLLVAGYDDLQNLSSVAESYDIIIHAAAGWNMQVSKALIQGLGQRKQKVQHKVHFFGISGVTNIADRPLTRRTEIRTLSDEEDIYSFLKERQAEEEYMPRAADIAVVESGLELGVETYIVMAPHIFGVGTGSFNRFTFPVNMMMNGAKAHGKGFVIGTGDAVWSHIHVEDLADLYLVLLKRVVDGETIASGKKGIYFAESGSNSQMEISQMVAKAGKDLGLLPSDEVEHVDLETGAKLFGGWGISMAESGGASNARIKSVLGPSLGWVPKREADWKTTIRLELEESEKRPPHPRDFGKLSAVTDK